MNDPNRDCIGIDNQISESQHILTNHTLIYIYIDKSKTEATGITMGNATHVGAIENGAAQSKL